MPFEKGNELGKKAKVFKDALKRAIAQDDRERLRAGIERLLDEFADGKQWALEMVRDTMDGRPMQSVEISEDAENPIGAGYALISGFAVRLAAGSVGDATRQITSDVGQDRAILGVDSSDPLTVPH